jgi:threonine dehydrogenase-like Zn-dependent dehydrogenase
MWRDPVLSIENVPEPSISKPNDIIIQTLSCGICGSDLHCSEAGPDGFVTFGGQAKLPVILGHEFVGRVVSVGRNVKTLQKDDLITAESVSACWECAECLDGHLNECKAINLVGLTLNGAFAPYVCVDARHCFSIHGLVETLGHEVSCQVGAILEPIGVAYRGIIKKAKVCPGETVAIFGLGPIGLMSTIVAFYAGASSVIGFDLLDERVALAKRLGAKAFNISELKDGLSARDVVLELTKGRGVTVAVEAAGASSAFDYALSVLASRGRLLVLGRMPEPLLIDINNIMSSSIDIISSRGHAGYGIFPTLINLLATGAIDISQVITNHFNFTDVLQAFTHARLGNDGKILVNLNS